MAIEQQSARAMTDFDSSMLPPTGRLGKAFAQRSPFRHVVIESFFPADYATSLLDSFPAFERGNARNEDGELGGKSTVEKIRELGPAYAKLDDVIQTPAFLGWLGEVTGIPDLQYDPWYFGGGTHENRQGQDLDPHIDFNRHPENGTHRRLNLIVYLNREWSDDWGGSLELHTDPRSPDDEITLITPLFNRCVIFETTEWSWHGFSRIKLPEEKQSLSRKSIALYFYTRERPPEELASTHSTVYVDRPMPDHLVAGHTLTETDVAALRNLLTRRDMHNQRLYREVHQLQGRFESDSSQGSHVSRLLRGLRMLWRHRWVEGKALDRPAIKAAMLPFVSRLPSGMREPLRRFWRARDA